jgi:hypothetical protein
VQCGEPTDDERDERVDLLASGAAPARRCVEEVEQEATGERHHEIGRASALGSTLVEPRVRSSPRSR